MGSLLEKARRELEQAQQEARRTGSDHQSALRKVREAERQVQRLELAQVELDIYTDKVLAKVREQRQDGG
jgi:hypothetical protein